MATDLKLDISGFPELDTKEVYKFWVQTRDDREALGKKIAGYKTELMERLQRTPGQRITVDGVELSLQEAMKTVLHEPELVEALKPNDDAIKKLVRGLSSAQVKALCEAYPVCAPAIRAALERIPAGTMKLRVKKSKSTGRRRRPGGRR